jgi:hypothetical protein
LNLNVHFHTCFLDGIYVRDAAGHVVFHGAPPPSRDDLERVVRIVQWRAVRWLARRGHLERPPLEDGANEAALPSPIEACAAIATHAGTMRTLAPDAGSTNVAREAAGVDPAGPLREGCAVEYEGFNLHASVRIAAEDDRGRERLCRYGARPPFALERLRVLPGGRVAYRLKKLGVGRAKHRVMTPLELLARLAALVPPPRYPLVRSGVTSTPKRLGLRGAMGFGLPSRHSSLGYLSPVDYEMKFEEGMRDRETTKAA